MTTVRDFIQMRPVLAYFALTFAISWGGMLTLIGPSGFPVPTEESETMGPFLIALLGPGIAGIVLTALVAGRDGFRELVARLLKWRVAARWYAIALLPVPILMATVLVAFSVLFDDFTLSLSTTDDKAGLIIGGLIAGLVVATFEEVGWTGFAIPRLRMSHAVLTTGLIVGVIWGAWHFPMFWEEDSFSAALPLALLLARLLSWLPAYRILMVFVYDRTGSVLVVILMHASLLTVQVMLEPTTDSDALLLAHVLVLAAVLWVAVAAVAVRGRLLSWPSSTEGRTVPAAKTS